MGAISRVMKEKTSVIGSVSYVLIERLVRLISPLIYSIALTRLEGAELFGQYSYINTLYTIFLAISLIGLDSIAVREVVKFKSRFSRVIDNVMLVRIVWSFFVTVIYLLICFWVGVYSIGVFFSGLAIFLYSFNAPEYYFQGTKQFQVIAKISLFLFPVFLIIKIYLLYVSNSIESKFIIDAIEAVVYSISLLWFYKKDTLILPAINSYDLKLIKSLLKSSIPLALNSILVVLYFKIDQIMLANLLGYEQLGLYAAGSQISSMIGFVPMVLMTAIFPYLAEWMKSVDYEKKVIDIYQLFLIIILLISVVVYFGIDLVVLTIFGNEFRASGDIVKIHLIGFLFVYMGAVSGSIIVIKDLVWLSTIRSISSLLLNIILNFILIPDYGIFGAAWASVISQFMANYVFYLIIPKLRPEGKLINKAFILLPFRGFNAITRLYSAYKH